VAWFAGEPGSGGGKETDKEDEKEQGKKQHGYVLFKSVRGVL